MTKRVTISTNPPANEKDLIQWFHKMRKRAPIQEQPQCGEWHVFGYAEAKAVLADHGNFSNAASLALIPSDSPFMLFRVGHLPWMDPPRHQNLRALIQKVFTPVYVKSLEHMVIATVEQVLHRASAANEVAFVEQIATPIVSNVIAKVIGLPAGDEHQFGQWAASLMELTDPASTNNGMEVFITRTKQMHSFLHEYIANRRTDPGEDLTSALTQVEIDGAVLSDAEIAGLIALLMNTGVTSNQFLVNAIICLNQQPIVEEQVRSDPGLLAFFTEEVARYRGQTPRVQRFSMEDVVIGECKIPAGRHVSVWLTAANRDPRQFPDPDVFDMSRSPNSHVALGHGIHFCLGAALSRLQTSITLGQLLNMSKTVTVDYERSRLLDPRIVMGAAELTLHVRWGKPK